MRSRAVTYSLEHCVEVWSLCLRVDKVECRTGTSDGHWLESLSSEEVNLTRAVGSTVVEKEVIPLRWDDAGTVYPTEGLNTQGQRITVRSQPFRM